MGIVDEIRGMFGAKKHIGWNYWAHDRVIAEGRKYSNKEDFRKYSPGAENAARKNGWYEEATEHMQPIRNNYTYEECAAEAQKYHQRMEFKAGSLSHYTIALNHGWLNDICKHMDVLRRDYTLEECRDIAKGYPSRKEFQEGNISCYNYSLRHGWIDDVCSHMERQGTDAPRKVYVFEFADNHAYIGVACNIRRRYLRHQRDKESPVFRHIKETDAKWEFKELTDWLSKEESAAAEVRTIEEYKTGGWELLNSNRGGGLGSRSKKKKG